jgi:hypothetical protein
MPDLDSKPDLIFQWFLREGRGWKLLTSVLAVTLFGGGFLLLFQVVYPATKHQRLAPQRVLMLDLNSPVARQVVNSISDRDFLVLRESNTIATPVSARAPVFVPSFKGFDYRVRDFLETSNSTAPLPRVFQPDIAPLPALPAVATLARAAEMIPMRLQTVVVEGFEKRALTRTVTIGDAEAEGLRVRVAVARDGRVTNSVPMAASTSQMTLFAKLKPMLAMLRFAPDNEAEVQWGTIRFEWVKEGKKP